jgi:hypothetical protein
MASIRGKIINPVTTSGRVISEIEAPVNIRLDVDMKYQSSSTSTFLETERALFLPTDLSNINNIFLLSKPEKFGNGIFRNRLTEKNIPLYFSGNSSDPILEVEIIPNNLIRYIDGGKKYQLLASRNESKNYGWQPVSNSELYSYVERSDFDSFDFPQITIRGVRKIPATTADTLCGPVTYTGYTYDRLNYNWFFGQNAGISFLPIISGGTPITVSGSVVSQEGVSSISNEEGNLLFYTNGETVYTSGNTVMVNGTGLSSSGTSTQSCIIVPKPESNKYYIFTTDYDGSPNGFEYSIVNMELQGGDGEVETKNIKLINNPITEKVTACNHSDDGYWVITHTSGDSTYYSYRLSSSGLTGPITTSIGTTHSTARGYMKTSPNGEKLISLLYDEDTIDIFDFDSSGGTLSNFLTITGMTFDVGPYGLEFSSDSSKFYVSEGAGEKVYQFDLSYTAGTDIMNNVIEVGNVSGSSLGALQMGPDERIYVADYNSSNLHIIHRPNGLGVQCNFQQSGFSLTTSAVTGTSSFWGLPNIITNKSLSCDRSVYIVNKSSRTGYLFEFLVNNVNDVVIPKNLSYYGEVYKYDTNLSLFTKSAVNTISIEHSKLTGDTINEVFIPLNEIGEGEFIIKSYWNYDINTLMYKQLKKTKNSVDTYKRGELYGLYSPETDWYFISLFEADKPLFSNNFAPVPGGINNLSVSTTLTTSGVTKYFYNNLSEPIVSYNGSVLAKNIEYSASTSGTSKYIELLFSPLDKQILTIAYVTNGSTDDLLTDLYTVRGAIKSGATGTQLSTDRVFYNTTQNKYEFYLLSEPVTDIVISINGSVLAKNIEYYRSSSNSRRIILEETLKSGDIIECFYTPKSAINGPISTNQPNISWFINNSPLSTNGRFVVEFADSTDEEFNTILYSAITNYVISQKTYNSVVSLTNAVAGDKFVYRVKNEKFYQPISGETIYSFSYSDVNEIEITSNNGNTY